MPWTTTVGLSLQLRLMIVMWIPASAGMTKSGSDDALDNHGGIVPTIAVDDCNVDSRFRGNDEIRVG